ncbi:MAG TPA: hypothetical protein VG871_24095 [Vicinamibacterales bacterium]|nr:hypothetical protein [Vicinamibacterales bacterium]
MKYALACAPAAAMLCTSAAARDSRTTIRGSARDAGGVIQSASVQLIEDQTGLRRATSTNAVGAQAALTLDVTRQCESSTVTMLADHRK